MSAACRRNGQRRAEAEFDAARSHDIPARERFAGDADLREALDLDSMDMLNLVTALARRLAIDIPEIGYPCLATLDGASEYLAAKAGRVEQP